MRLPWPQPDPMGPGQESVWDYPRPPRLERSDRHVVVRQGDAVLADTRDAWRVMETSHAPSWYLPPGDIDMGYLRQAEGRSLCEWKGQADYLDVVVGSLVVARAAWRYRNPVPAFAPIAGYIAFYPGAVECTVDGHAALPQPGGFYGGWITPDVVGPFKGGEGTLGW
jgi:uncharacterized protein (DUF427 family)